MDATTQKSKTLAVVFTTLLLGSVFVAGVATAHTNDFTGTPGNAPAVADPNTVPHLTNTPAVAHYDQTGQAQLVWPSGGVSYNNTYDFTLTAVISGNAPTPASGGYFLVGPTGPSGPAKEVLANGSTVQPTNDCEHNVTGASCGTPTLKNLTFAGQKFDEAGIWSVEYMSTLANVPLFTSIDTFFVNSTANYNLSSSQYAWGYSPSASFGYTLTVTNETGSVVQGAAVTATPAATGLPAGGQTNANGQIGVLVSGTPAAGTYLLNATKNIAGTSAADVFGQANLTIVGAPVTWLANSTTATVGFAETVKYTPVLPNGNPAFSAINGLGSAVRVNYSVTLPNGSVIYANVTGLPTTNTTLAYLCYDPTIGGAISAVTCNLGWGASVFQVNTFTGEIQYAPGATYGLWQSGVYTIAVKIDTDNTPGNNVPEYLGSTTFQTTGAEGVNLALTDTGGNTLTSIAVLPVSGGALQLQSVKLKITGSTIAEHPLCETTDGNGCVATPNGTTTNFVNNVTVTGPILNGTLYNTMTTTPYVPATGVVQIDNIVPTGSGNLTFSVTWKGITKSITIPTTAGGVIAENVTAIQVGTEQNVTVTVHDASTNYVSTATITGIFEDGTAVSTSNLPVNPFPVAGNGTADHGQQGVYRVDLKAATTKNVILQATIQPPGGTASYALIRLQVQAGHDLVVVLDKNATSAGLPTKVQVNATASSVGPSPSTAKVYFLTAQEKKDLLANGSAALPTTSGLGIRFFGAGGGAFTAFTNSSSGISQGDYNVSVALASGAYYVYVQDAAGASLTHDNLNDMVLFNVYNYTVTFTPASIPIWWVGLSNATVNVTIQDYLGANLTNNSGFRYSALNSTGGLVDASSHAQTDAALNQTSGINNGFKATTLTGGFVGVIKLEVQPNGGIFTGATGALTIAGPTVTVTPSSVNLLSAQILTVTVANLTGGPIAGAEVRVCGISLNSNFPATPPTTLSASDKANCTAVDPTNVDGTAAVSVSPNGLSPLTVYVNDTTTGVTVPVFAGTLALSVDKPAPTAGNTVIITAAQTAGAAGSAGILVNVTNDGTNVKTATTDASGHLTLVNVTAGNYSVVATRSGFLPGFLNFTVGANGTNGTVTATGPHYKLSNLTLDPSTVTVGSPVSVSVDITNDGSAAGAPVASLYVGPVGAEKFQGSLTGPSLAVGEKVGLQFAPVTPITSGVTHVIVKIGADVVADKTVTVNPVGGTTTSTPVSSTPVSSTPVSSTPVSSTPVSSTPVSSTPVSSSPVSSTPVSSTPATTTPSPKVPGFEVVALLGAIAAALLVLRRRN